MPKLSVVMPAYNAEKFLARTLDSILSQTFTDFELIVVEDASTDRTRLILDGYKDSRLRVLHSEKHQGLCAGPNRGLREARGRYIARHDADDISFPTRFEKQIRFLEEHPEVGLVGHRIVRIDEEGFLLYIEEYPESHEAICQALAQGNCFNHNSMMFRREVYERIGGYREGFVVSEDYDFAVRVSEVFKVHILRDVLGAYRLHLSSVLVQKKNAMEICHQVLRESARLRQEGKDDSVEPLFAEAARRASSQGWFRRQILKIFQLKSIAVDSYGMGCVYLVRGNRTKARAYFARSVSYFGFYHKAWIAWIASHLLSSAKIQLMFRESVNRVTVTDRLLTGQPVEKYLR